MINDTIMNYPNISWRLHIRP